MALPSTTIMPNPDFKVTLVRAASAFPGSTNIERVVWDVSPEFNESRSVVYKNIDPVHAPGAIYQYAGTGSRTFTINGKFISRSVNEATKTLAYIQYLRTWAMPVFGRVGDDPPPGENTLGAPPAVLLLSAYSMSPPGDFVNTYVPTGPERVRGNQTGRPMQKAIGNNIFQVPVVITNLDIPFPADVDYIPTVNNYPVPMITNVSLTLVETHSPNRYSGFDLQAFKNGNLVNF